MRCIYAVSSIFIFSLLSGCGTLSVISLSAASISYMTTGKSVSDHLYSSLTNQDCAIHRLLFDSNICKPVLTPGVLLAKSSVEQSPRLNEAPQLLTVIPPNDEKTITSARTAEIAHRVEAHRYIVIGSFNDFDFAKERQQNNRDLNAELIVNQSHSKTRYRVVIGPFNDGDNVEQLLAGIHKPVQETTWLLSLCADSLTPPPCDGNQFAQAALK